MTPDNLSALRAHQAAVLARLDAAEAAYRPAGAPLTPRVRVAVLHGEEAVAELVDRARADVRR